MEYLEFLEHMKTLLAARRREGCFADAVDAEIRAERRRGELAIALSRKPTNHPFHCPQCGEVIMYGERQHVCHS